MNTTMDRSDGDQLPLPLASDPGPVPASGARSARRVRRRDRQLWLFAPYRQVDLPMTPDAPSDTARDAGIEPPPD